MLFGARIVFSEGERVNAVAASISKINKKIDVARPMFYASDLFVACELLLLSLFALFISERHWKVCCLWYEWLKWKVGLFSIEGIFRGRSRLGKATAIDALRIAATRSEHHVQVLRELILGWNADIELRGEGHLAKALEQGKGAVLWIAHFSFNALATKMALRAAGFPVHHISRPEHGFSKSAFGINFLNPLRVKAELPYLASRIVIDRSSPSKSMQAAIRSLRMNELVSITAGAWEGQTLVSVDVFGTYLELAAGVPRLAIAAGAPLLPVFTIRPDCSHKIQVNIGAAIQLSEESRDQLIKMAAQCFVEETARYAAKYPDQWRDWEKLKEPEDGGYSSPPYST